MADKCKQVENDSYQQTGVEWVTKRQKRVG
jgi:hypothetical protein